MSAPKAYVLIRTTLTSLGACINSKRYEYFNECLNSVLSQSFENVSILLLQDTRTATKGGVEKTPLPRFCSKICDDWQRTSGTRFNRDLHFYKANCNGPALALYYLRKELQIMYPQPDDVVILLDDDDFLVRESAVNDVVDKMTRSGSADICLLSYKNVGDSSLDISNGAGHIHNSLVKGLDGKYKSADDYISADDAAGWLSLTDSLGWTKAYRYSVVEKYMDALMEYFDFDENRLIKYYWQNNAYEDFPDIINLCWNGIRITGCKEPTHAYRKTTSSITANPRLKDFTRKRPAYLSLLLGLARNADLSKAGKMTIARYVIIKLILIENILAKFRNDGSSHNLFRRFTEREYFFRCLTDRLTSDNTIHYFAELLKNVSLYKNNIKSCFNPETIIKEAASSEVKLGYVDVQQCIREKVLIAEKPIRRYSHRLMATVITCCSIISCIIVCAIIISKKGDAGVDTIVSISGTIVAAIIAYMGTSIGNYLSKKDQDKEAIRIYRNELSDMIRHLYANLNILFQIQKDLNEDIIPAEIHFINLKIPQNSVLLSEEPIKNILINELDTIARIKVNIRNINNSADYLCSLVQDKTRYDVEIMRASLEWEITRYVGYIINLLYVIDDPSFRFPDKEQLKRYINIKGVLETMSKEICGINTDKTKDEYDDNDRLLIVKRLIKEYEKYINDRERKRNVLFNKKK